MTPDGARIAGIFPGGGSGKRSGDLEHRIRTAAERRLGPCRSTVYGRFSALDKGTAEQHDAPGGAGGGARLSHLVQMTIVIRIVFCNYARDAGSVRRHAGSLRQKLIYTARTEDRKSNIKVLCLHKNTQCLLVLSARFAV